MVPLQRREPLLQLSVVFILLRWVSHEILRHLDLVRLRISAKHLVDVVEVLGGVLDGLVLGLGLSGVGLLLRGRLAGLGLYLGCHFYIDGRRILQLHIWLGVGGHRLWLGPALLLLWWLLLCHDALKDLADLR